MGATFFLGPLPLFQQTEMLIKQIHANTRQREEFYMLNRLIIRQEHSSKYIITKDTVANNNAQRSSLINIDSFDLSLHLNISHMDLLIY